MFPRRGLSREWRSDRLESRPHRDFGIGSKRAAGFFLWFLVLYALFMAPWPGLQDAYRAAFIGTGGLVFESFGSPHGVRFKPRDDEGPADTTVFVRHRRADGSVSININSRQVGYLPTAVAASLILATPIPWSRRGRALFWGLVLVNAFIALRLTIMLTHAWSHELSAGSAGQATLWDKTVAAGVLLVATGQAVSYIAPMLLWILVTFRRGDWVAIAEHARHKAYGSSSRPVAQTRLKSGRGS